MLFEQAPYRPRDCSGVDLPRRRLCSRMLANRSSNVLRTTRRFCAAGSRFEWQTLPSGLRIKHVRLAAHGGLGRPPEGSFPCSTQVSDGNQGDDPVGDNQTIRVTYSTRLEDNTVLISNRVASFKVGSSSQVRHAPAPPTPPPPSCCRMSSCLWRALLRSVRRLTRECGGCVLETAGAHPHRVLPHRVPPPLCTSCPLPPARYLLPAEPPRVPRRSAGSYARRSI